uniref:Fibronectin type-III domain-containing protein n=1 Tax=Amphimedon queenslandica TaxID=400682 RepID=A0A1X7TSL2_AMPQE
DHYTIPVPPIQYYIIKVYNTSNSIIYNNNTTNTNITITGLPLTDTNYTVTIIPVNIIGYGPSATVNVCPGDRLVFTCTITPIITGTVYWRIPGQDSQQLEPVSGPETHHNLILNATIEDGTITSTGIYESVSVSLNGSEVGCARIQNIDELEKITIKIRTVPAQVVNISWDQISTDTITIWWNNNEDYSTVPVPPIQYYIISVYNTSNSIIYTNNTNDTNITITGLPLTDTNYTVTIIPVNIIGYGPSATVNVNISNAMTSTSIPSVTLTTSISTSIPLYTSSTS